MRRVSCKLAATLSLMIMCGYSGGADRFYTTDNSKAKRSEIDLYVTLADSSKLFEQVPLNFNKGKNLSPNKVILNPTETFQIYDGFGAAITGSTSYNLLKMERQERAAFLHKVFDPRQGVCYSYIRVSIGCSDFSLDEFTWEDEPGKFEVHELDRRDLFPILREILAINPDIKIIGSPWTAPRWMKVNNLEDLQPFDSWIGGQLNPKYYQHYAEYFVKWIKTMEAEGFTIDAITIQNEPLNRGNSASMYMGWEEQRDFIKNNLGPEFRKNDIKTKVQLFDHNYNYDNIADQQNYPLRIYEDAQAAQYVDGAAYHAYGGDKIELIKIHEARPDKNIYFTEMSIGEWGSPFPEDLMWNMREVFLGTVNNWSKSVVMWNLMLDDEHKPNREGGCTTCYGVVDIDSKDYKTIKYNSHYYNIAHLSKVIKPGAVRIGTSGYKPGGLYYTAAKNPDGSYGVVAQNDTRDDLNVTFALGERSFTYLMPAKSIASFNFL